MTPIAEPVARDRLAAELTAGTYVTRFKDLEVHLFEGREAPSVLDEIGRIRETEYRHVGAGRNVERDLDRFDTEHPAYRQIVSYDRAEGEIVAMYRAIHCGWALESAGPSALRTTSLFAFSARFQAEELPFLVELGRSVVNRNARRAVQGLFSVWSGLGALMREWSDISGFFGNVSVYRDTHDQHLDTLLGYLDRYHGDRGARVRAKRGNEYLSRSEPTGEHRKQNIPDSLSGLVERASAEGWTLPPILISYLKAAPGLVAFETAVDPDFGNAREIAIMVPVDAITAKTRKRIIDPYVSVNPERFRLASAARGQSYG